MARSHALVIVPTYNERENLPALVEALLQHAGRPRAGRRRPVARRHRRRSPTSSRARIRTASRSCTAPSSRGLGRSYIDGIQRGAATGRSTSSARWTPTSRTTPRICRRCSRHAERADIVIGSRYVAGGAVVNWPLRRRLLSRFANGYIRADHPPRGARLHERLSLLAARGARLAAARPLRLGRLLVPGRDAVRGVAARTAASPKCRLPSSSGARASRRCRARCFRIGDHAVAARRVSRNGTADGPLSPFRAMV